MLALAITFYLSMLAPAGERFKLINQLDEEDKSTVLKIIDKMLTNKKFKNFFDKNLASL
ncbi:hypothetical protein TSEDIMI_20194 [Tenacibaculum sediminilitoris]|uniref:hypothetical protein n=1 Tax=Tenacibaculum sediminilitoris TaxID=1820334 RepID=UPI003894BAF2